MASKDKAKKDGEELGFDERLEKLEALVSELEDGELDLESAIGRYQDGITLLKDCHGTLGKYKKRIEELSLDASETISTVADPDFDQ
jgi:exodeoxyribonuclease VII small subunit